MKQSTKKINPVLLVMLLPLLLLVPSIRIKIMSLINKKEKVNPPSNAGVIVGPNFEQRLERFLETHEGRKNYAYQDQAGHWTIGIGHKILPNEAYLKTAHIGDSEVSTLFKKDIAIARAAVNNGVTVGLNDSQRIALISLAFNIGAGAFAKSSLLKELNMGYDKTQVAKRFLDWKNVRINGVLTVSNGLLKRRNSEANMFKS